MPADVPQSAWFMARPLTDETVSQINGSTTEERKDRLAEEAADG